MVELGRQRAEISHLELPSLILLLAHSEDTYHHIILKLIYLSSQKMGVKGLRFFLKHNNIKFK